MSQASSIFFLYWRRGFFISKKRFFFLEKKAFLFSSKKRILFFYWKTGFYFLLKKGFSYPRNELLLYKKYFQLQSIFCVSTTKKNSQEINSLYIYICFRGFWTTKNFVKFYTRTMQDPVKNNIIITLLKYFQCHHYDIRIVISFKLTFEIFFWNVYIQKNNTFTKMHFL